MKKEATRGINENIKKIIRLGSKSINAQLLSLSKSLLPLNFM